jgi:hypothetical protein
MEQGAVAFSVFSVTLAIRMLHSARIAVRQVSSRTITASPHAMVSARAGVVAVAIGILVPSAARCETRFVGTPLNSYQQQLRPNVDASVVPSAQNDENVETVTTIIVAGQQRTIAGWFSQILAFAIDTLLDNAVRSLNQFVWGGWEDPSKADIYGT